MLIAYDRDDAGERAARSSRTKLMAEGLDCYRILFPKGMDANEYALKVPRRRSASGFLIRKALWLGKGTPPPITTASAEPVLTLDNAPTSRDEGVRD